MKHHYVKRHKTKHFNRVLSFVLIFILTAAAVLALAPPAPARAADFALTITGEGVEREVSFTLDQLKTMAGSVSQNAYSAWNTWPAKSVYYARGVELEKLLERAGLKSDATTINVSEAAPKGGGTGYNMTFLLDDLLTTRYTYEGGKAAVPAILAFKLSDKSFDAMDDTDLRLVYGQLAEYEQTSQGFVKAVSVITVTREPARKLAKPEVSAEKLPDGRYSVTMTSDNINAKIYYTVDGSEPSVGGKMYNISAPNWQPQLNAPITVNGDTRIKAITVAYGYADSDVVSFVADPASLAPPAPPTPAPAPGLIAAPATPVGAGDGIKVIIDGKAMTFEVPPRIVNDRILVPLRAIFEEMGADVEYDDETRTVTATKGDTVVVLTIGDASPTVNGVVVTIDQPGIVVDNRTLAPLRFVAEAFGGTVEWVDATKTATITK